MCSSRDEFQDEESIVPETNHNDFITMKPALILYVLR